MITQDDLFIGLDDEDCGAILDEYRLAAKIMFLLILFGTILFKVLFFLQVYEKYALLVDLVLGIRTKI